MDNYILKQFSNVGKVRNYEFGTVVEVQSNDVYIVETISGLSLVIQDIDAVYSIGDSVVLALSDGTINNAFIIKKNTQTFPTAINFIVGNDLN